MSVDGFKHTGQQVSCGMRKGEGGRGRRKEGERREWDERKGGREREGGPSLSNMINTHG